MKAQINWVDHLFNIISVIIGVSLAFWVNDNAASNQRQQEYRLVIDSFLEELSSDRATYAEYQIDDNKDQVATISQVLQLIATGEGDSLEIKFSRAIRINNYFPSGVTFNSLQSAGKLDLIKDFELRKELSTYHTVLAEEAQIRGQVQVDFYMNQLMPWIARNTDFRNPDPAALQHPELSNLLMLYQSFILNKVVHYEEMVERIGNLESKLQQIKKENKE